MKRRNAESGKMRRSIKRTKISEGMYGNSMLYLKFVMLWAAVVIADYMLEFRFEFLWPFWMMIKTVYDSFKFQGFAYSVFFLFMALTSDIVFFCYMPASWMFIAASTYVWVQCVWYTVADKGVCLPTVALCGLVAYVEGAMRITYRGGGLEGGGLELYRPLTAHCVGYPVVTLGFGFKYYVGQRLRLRQMQIHAENELYYELMKESMTDGTEQNQEQKHPNSKEADKPVANGSVDHQTKTEIHTQTDHKHMNGSAVHTKSKKCSAKVEQNGTCHNEHSLLQFKLEKLEKHVAARERNHALSNGTVAHDDAHHEEEKQEVSSKVVAKSSKCDKKESSTLKEERRKNKNKDKDSNDSHKSTENTKETIKEVESTKENTKISSNQTHKEKDKEREKEREREREQLRECTEELRRVRAELTAARAGEAEARRALDAATAAERARRADHSQLRAAHHSLHHKMATWRGSIERRLGEERRARTAAEQQLRAASEQRNAECENEWCISKRNTHETEAANLKRDLQRARDRAIRVQRDLTAATEQIRSLEARQEECTSPNTRLASAYQSLQERAAHLERSLSAETRVKLDLLSALGEAKRQLTIREGLITKQGKELEELKAQMLAVMPTNFVTPGSGSVSKLRLSDGSPLDPNASVYTPKQLCSDA